jgi:hypothetical protein
MKRLSPPQRAPPAEGVVSFLEKRRAHFTDKVSQGMAPVLPMVAITTVHLIRRTETMGSRRWRKRCGGVS